MSALQLSVATHLRLVVVSAGCVGKQRQADAEVAEVHQEVGRFLKCTGLFQAPGFAQVRELCLVTSTSKSIGFGIRSRVPSTSLGPTEFPRILGLWYSQSTSTRAYQQHTQANPQFDTPLNPKTLKPKTLKPKTLNPKTLKP